MNGSYTSSVSSSYIWERERRKIVFQYALMLLASWIAGWILPRFLSNTLWQQAQASVSTHFMPSLASGKALFQTAYSFFIPTFLCIIVVALFSFSVLNCLVTDGVLIYLGMRTGCTVSILYSLFRGIPSLSYRPSLLGIFIFVLFKLLLLLIFASYAIRMAKYAYRLRIYSKVGRTLFHPNTVGALICHFTICTVVLFLLHLLYIYSIYFASK